MPQLDIPRNVVARFTFRDRVNCPDGELEDFIGTYTGEIDSWGKRTIYPLDKDRGKYYLFADEIAEVEVLSDYELQAEIEGIHEARIQHAVRLLREADALLISVEGASRYRRASEVARCSLLVQKAIVAAEGGR